MFMFLPQEILEGWNCKEIETTNSKNSLTLKKKREIENKFFGR